MSYSWLILEKMFASYDDEYSTVFRGLDNIKVCWQTGLLTVSVAIVYDITAIVDTLHWSADLEGGHLGYVWKIWLGERRQLQVWHLVFLVKLVWSGYLAIEGEEEESCHIEEDFFGFLLNRPFRGRRWGRISRGKALFGTLIRSFSISCLRTLLLESRTM